MPEKQPFFPNLTEEELDAGTENAVEYGKSKQWKTDALNIIALERVIDNTVAAIKESEHEEAATRALGEVTSDEHDLHVTELKRLNYQLENAQLIEQNLLEKMKSFGKTLDEALAEKSQISENDISGAEKKLLNTLSDVAIENQLRTEEVKTVEKEGEAREAMDEAA